MRMQIHGIGWPLSPFVTAALPTSQFSNELLDKMEFLNDKVKKLSGYISTYSSRAGANFNLGPPPLQM